MSLRPEKPKEALIYLNANKSLRIVLDCLDTAHKKLQNPLSQNDKGYKLPVVVTTRVYYPGMRVSYPLGGKPG